MNNQKAVVAGQAVYSKNVLSIYDLWVLGFSNHFLWKCPTRLIAKQFHHLASTNHLDVGVGTGYYLKRYLSNINRRLALLDLNENSLQAAGKAVRHFKPELYQGDIFQTLGLNGKKFDSISINYLLHCLPGDMSDKSLVFSNLKAVLNDGGVLFGSTILGKGITANYCAQKLMNLYNRKGIFSNQDDDLASLEVALNTHFSEVKIEVVGCVAIFSAINR